ncbi:basic phospholipase A2 PA-10A [Planococcus citri]|uniref:basic phospholipase A2 PA-10A n=1 Tax=Planococcus citri TaxID=170843 RepID=UPI0031F82B14
MYHAHRALIVVAVIFIFHFIPQVPAARYKPQDFEYTMKNRSETTMPLDVYVSYSHNPLGESYKIVENEKSTNDRNPNRSKRGILELYNMVVCATGCNPLIYKGYGCYCGFLGSGYPVDPIDSCCKRHDWCYNTANCPMFLEYFTPYTWTCYSGQPICINGWSCSYRLCECDRQLAECLSQYGCPRRKAVCTTSPWRLFQNLARF